MPIINMNIERVIVHEVIRAAELNSRSGVQSNDIISLDDESRDILTKRILNMLSSGTHCVDLIVEDLSQGSPFNITTCMLDASNSQFIKYSKQLSYLLSSAQTSGTIKPGSGLFIQGTVDYNGNRSRIIAIIKADPDKGLFQNINNNQITLKYVNNILFGASSRLMKIAFFIEENNTNNIINSHEQPNIRVPEDFSIKVFDHQMQNSTNGNVSLYFYKTFLKCNIAENAAVKTKEFYEIAKEFINNNIPQNERVDLYGDLISYLRSNEATISAQTFATNYLKEERQDEFLNNCRDCGIAEPISKDTQLIKGKLKKQSIKFTSNVTLIAENVNDSVRNISSTEDGWTTLEIMGEIKPIL